MFDPSCVRAITLDLDDTLWPMRPAIARAEEALQAWLAEHAPSTAALLSESATRHAIRAEIERRHADRLHDLTFLRREAIRAALLLAGDDPALAEPAFEVFYAKRQCVTLYEDARPALELLAARYPVIALSNGNADLRRIGLEACFYAQLGAREAGVAKPDARIFHAAAALAGVPAHAVLHVGDDPHRDALGALRAGMQAGWLDRAALGWQVALSQPVHGPTACAAPPPQPHERPHLHLPDLLALCDALGLSRSVAEPCDLAP